jgi:phenylacetate-CoA ligase
MNAECGVTTRTLESFIPNSATRIPQLSGGPMKIRRYFDPEMETMDREELEALQLFELKLQLRRCHRDSEFYREKFKKAGIKPDHIRSLDDMVHVPFVTKAELREEQQAHPHFGRSMVAPPENWAELHPSPATTGAPIHTIWSHEDVKKISKWTARTAKR